jgi:Lrp/AsnC family leucine-responsive transcriptional regulator
MSDLDRTDYKILAILQRDGRITNAALAKRVGLTPAPTLARVKKLEAAGYIRRYVALLDPARLGLPVTAFVSVILESHRRKTSDDFRAAVAKLPEVLECHHIAGDEDFLLKVVAASPGDYESFVLGKLTKIGGIEKVKTIFVLSSSKLETALPIREEGGASEKQDAQRRATTSKPNSNA